MWFSLRNTGNRKDSVMDWLQDKEKEVIWDFRLGDWVSDVAAETGNTGAGQGMTARKFMMIFPQRSHLSGEGISKDYFYLQESQNLDLEWTTECDHSWKRRAVWKALATSLNHHSMLIAKQKLRVRNELCSLRISDHRPLTCIFVFVVLWMSFIFDPPRPIFKNKIF